MRKRIACVTAAILSISLGVSGCGLIPFEQDIPFLSSRAENVETEKKTEQQTIDEQDADTEKSTEDTQQDDGLNEGEQTDNEDTEEADEKQENPMEQAALMAVQYDYDGAIELLKSQPDYESNTDMQSAVSDYENTKATCTEYPLEQITHVFFHTLIKDTARAFDGDSDSNGYNQYMTTIDEFNNRKVPRFWSCRLSVQYLLRIMADCMRHLRNWILISGSFLQALQVWRSFLTRWTEKRWMCAAWDRRRSQ